MDGQAKKRLMVGTVVSDKMDKTIVVAVSRDFQHKKLQKVMRRTKKYKVHDEQEVASMGDMVEFYEGRPVSKTKCRYLARVVSSAKNG